MAYQIIQPPFTLVFAEISKAELKAYFSWFQSIRPERLAILENAVKSDPNYQTWAADFSPSSLDLLGQWFASQANTRTRTDAEIQKFQSGSPYSIEVPNAELTNHTFSIAMDIGMYISQVFESNYPTLQWSQPFGSKTFIDYGQPVLTGFGVTDFNPVRMMVTCAYGLVSGKNSSSSLREIYDIWSKKIKPS